MSCEFQVYDMVVQQFCTLSGGHYGSCSHHLSPCNVAAVSLTLRRAVLFLPVTYLLYNWKSAFCSYTEASLQALPSHHQKEAHPEICSGAARFGSTSSSSAPRALHKDPPQPQFSDSFQPSLHGLGRICPPASPTLDSIPQDTHSALLTETVLSAQ